ncbi:nucleotide-binding protein [Roseibium sp. TrichSKD4]|nr:nucleotide-binding protein [Roseibium sp. TrichSKD4]
MSEINCAATTFVSIETGQFDGQIMTPSERVDQETVFAFIQSLPADDPDQRGIQRIDTGANVIFLTGKKAYKIKRDVQYPFLDYSTLALRKRACEREIELNAPHAPQIYRSAKPITRSPQGHLEIDGDGEPVE